MRVLLLLLFLASCSSKPRPAPPLPVVQPAPRINLEEIKPYAVKGTSTVTGQAFLKTIYGGVIPAAGERVKLIPSTTTVDAAITDSPDSAYFSVLSDLDGKGVRVDISDASGHFKFTEVPPGKYWVVTLAPGNGRWGVGSLIGRAVVKSGDQLKIIVSN